MRTARFSNSRKGVEEAVGEDIMGVDLIELQRVVYNIIIVFKHMRFEEKAEMMRNGVLSFPVKSTQ